MNTTRDELLAAAELAIRARDKRIAQLEKRVAELEEAQEPKHDPERMPNRRGIIGQEDGGGG